MIDRGKVIVGLEHELQNRGKCGHYCRDGVETVSCEYDKYGLCIQHWGNDALALLKAQEPRVMTLEEVIALPYGYVLIETDKEGSLRWVDALLFCKNTNFSFDFITLEGRARLLGAEYNKEWRCWTSRPDEQVRIETPWSE